MKYRTRLIVVVLVISAAIGIPYGISPDPEITIAHAFENVYRFEGGQPLEQVQYKVLKDHNIKFDPQVEVVSGSTVYRVNLKTGLVESAVYGDAFQQQGSPLTMEEARSIGFDFAAERYTAFCDLHLVSEVDNADEGYYHFVWAQLVEGIRTPHDVSMKIVADNSAVLEYRVRSFKLKGIKATPEVGAQVARSTAEESLAALPVSDEAEIGGGDPELRVVWAVPMDKYTKILQDWDDMKSPVKLRSEMKLILAWLMPLEWDSPDDACRWPSPFPVNAINGEPYVLAHL